MNKTNPILDNSRLNQSLNKQPLLVANNNGKVRLVNRKKPHLTINSPVAFETNPFAAIHIPSNKSQANMNISVSSKRQSIYKENQNQRAASTYYPLIVTLSYIFSQMASLILKKRLAISLLIICRESLVLDPVAEERQVPTNIFRIKQIFRMMGIVR